MSDSRFTAKPVTVKLVNQTSRNQSQSKAGTNGKSSINDTVQNLLSTSNNKQIIIVSNGNQQIPSANSNQAISLSGLSAQQLTQILQSYGVIGGSSQQKQQKAPQPNSERVGQSSDGTSANIIVVSANQQQQQQQNQPGYQSSLSALGQNLQQQIQQLQAQNHLMQQQILANASLTGNSTNIRQQLINSPLSQYINDNDLLLQNLTHQLHQHQKQQMQQQQINNLQRQINQMRDQKSPISSDIQQSPKQVNPSLGTHDKAFKSQLQIPQDKIKKNKTVGPKPHAVSHLSTTGVLNEKRMEAAAIAASREKAAQQPNKKSSDKNQSNAQTASKTQSKKDQQRLHYSSATQRNKSHIDHNQNSNYNTSNLSPSRNHNEEKKQKNKKSKKGAKLSIQQDSQEDQKLSQIPHLKNHTSQSTRQKEEKETSQISSNISPKKLLQLQNLQLPPQIPQTPALTAKEKRRIKAEEQKEKERQLFEKNFKASSLYIHKMGLHNQKSFVSRNNAIIVYHQWRLVKLDISLTSLYSQNSAAVPNPCSVVPPVQKQLLITPEQLHDFYNHSKVKYFNQVTRHLEVTESPKSVFKKDQDDIDQKAHTIQEKKIKEVLDQQLKEKSENFEQQNLAKNPIIFPSANIKETTIFFNSRFESGNLREVEKLSEFEYNCYVNFDFNSSTHSQWYYFSVRNIGKGRQYKFNIMNLQKDESCYQIGMKPFVYSTRRNWENGNNLWKRGCENVCYYKNKLRTKVRECAPDYEFDEESIPCYEYEDEASQMVTLNTLSFCYEFEYENDITYFAYFQPYTLNDLEDYLFLINKKYEPEHLQNIYKCEILCNTVQDRPCYVLTITDNVNEDDIDIDEITKKEKAPEEEKQPETICNSGRQTAAQGSSRKDKQAEKDKENEELENNAVLSGYQMMARDKKDFDPSMHQKQTVFLTARVHPGESNASFMIQGAIDFLLQRNNKEAKLLRETFIFKIIPMLNPDGVVNGHYRCNMVGADLNRRWPNPSKLLHPTIYYTKKLLKMCHQDNQVLLFCDFHGHTRKRNVFMYGCVSPQTEINQHKNNNLIRIIPYLLDQKNKLFSFADCKFANEKEKESTGRLVMFKEFGILNSYTIESTFYSHYHPRMGQRKKVNVEDEFQVKVEELVLIGNDFCEALTAIINSKILKRKFIVDTTTPLGSMQPGQGGNPLTAFLIAQQTENQIQKASQNSNIYNQQNNVQSVIKSFINGPSLGPYTSQIVNPVALTSQSTQNQMGGPIQTVIPTPNNDPRKKIPQSSKQSTMKNHPRVQSRQKNETQMDETDTSKSKRDLKLDEVLVDKKKVQKAMSQNLSNSSLPNFNEKVIEEYGALTPKKQFADDPNQNLLTPQVYKNSQIVHMTPYMKTEVKNMVYVDKKQFRNSNLQRDISDKYKFSYQLSQKKEDSANVSVAQDSASFSIKQPTADYADGTGVSSSVDIKGRNRNIMQSINNPMFYKPNEAVPIFINTVGSESDKNIANASENSVLKKIEEEQSNRAASMIRFDQENIMGPEQQNIIDSYVNIKQIPEKKQPLFQIKKTNTLPYQNKEETVTIKKLKQRQNDRPLSSIPTAPDDSKEIEFQSLSGLTLNNKQIHQGVHFSSFNNQNNVGPILNNQIQQNMLKSTAFQQQTQANSFFTSSNNTPFPTKQKFQTPHISSSKVPKENMIRKNVMIVPQQSFTNKIAQKQNSSAQKEMMSNTHSHFGVGQKVNKSNEIPQYGLREQKSKSSLSMVSNHQINQGMLNQNYGQIQKTKYKQIGPNSQHLSGFRGSLNQDAECQDGQLVKQNQMIELQQKMIYQRKVQAEIQVQQISQNLLNARNSLQSGQIKTNLIDKDQSKLPNINAVRTMTQNFVEKRPSSQSKKDTPHRNLVIYQNQDTLMEGGYELNPMFENQ